MIDTFASNEQNSFMIKQAVNFLKNNPVEIFINKTVKELISGKYFIQFYSKFIQSSSGIFYF
jgi:hypothetical protein